MSARVVFVDFAAWGASEPQQRRVCGPSGYVLRGTEARAAATAAELGLPLFTSNTTPTDHGERTLPGMAGWLAAHLAAQRTGVQRA